MEQHFYTVNALMWQKAHKNDNKTADICPIKCVLNTMFSRSSGN